MTLTLIRHNYSENYTEGELFLGEKKLCDTLEDKERVIRNKADKVAGYTAIPKGTYAIAWTYSPRFHRYTPEILQVPWFTAIRIHAGNTPEDTAGCILVGRKGEAKGTLVTSRVTAEKIYTLISSRILKGEKVQLIIC